MPCAFTAAFSFHTAKSSWVWRATAKVKAFLTKHIGSELPQLEHPTGRNPFTREILGQTPADRVAKLAAGEVPNAAPWREQVAEWLRLLEL